MKIGELVAGRYEVEALAGSGAMSSVYTARDRLLERRVALKVLHAQYSEDPEYVERFRREAQAIAKLSHPNIVTVIDRGEADGRQFIVFEHVPGENLKELVRRAGALPVERALALAHQSARGLAFAHEHGVVHRDVKPQNVLVNEDGVAKVTDFGIARSLDREEDGLTDPGTVLGTSDYIAPEQAEGVRVDERSDQYSLGVLLFELLTGEVPYPSENFVHGALRHVNDPVPSVRELRPDVSPRVDALVRRAMAKRPADRFPNTDAMIAALEACLAEERAARDGETQALSGGDVARAAPPAPTPRRAPPRAPRPRRPPGRRRVRLWAALAVVLGTAGLAAVLLAAQRVTGDGSDGGGNGGGGGPGAGAERVELVAVRDHDPEGDNQAEHPEDVPKATDGDPSTYWTTESYSSFTKSGVGLVVDAGEPVALSRLTIRTDLPGFTALVQAGSRRRGPFEEVSEERTVEARTRFDVDTGGEDYRYYLIWITDPNGRAHVNEVQGR